MKVFKNGPSKTSGRQPFKNVKRVWSAKAVHTSSNFKRLSSNNFTWCILEYFIPNSHYHTYNGLRISPITEYGSLIFIEKNLVDMKYWFQAREYPSNLVQKQMSKVNFSGNWHKKQTAQKSTGVPLVINYHPVLKDNGNIVYKKL